jgi:hypothetical protein
MRLLRGPPPPPGLRSRPTYPPFRHFRLRSPARLHRLDLQLLGGAVRLGGAARRISLLHRSWLHKPCFCACACDDGLPQHQHPTSGHLQIGALHPILLPDIQAQSALDIDAFALAEIYRAGPTPSCRRPLRSAIAFRHPGQPRSRTSLYVPAKIIALVQCSTALWTSHKARPPSRLQIAHLRLSAQH